VIELSVKRSYLSRKGTSELLCQTVRPAYRPWKFSFLLARVVRKLDGNDVQSSKQLLRRHFKHIANTK